MSKRIQPRDMVVSRVNGTRDHYVVGRVETSSTTDDGLTLIDIQPMSGREAAIERAYARLDTERKVWLFDGLDASDLAYDEAPKRDPEA